MGDIGVQVGIAVALVLLVALVVARRSDTGPDFGGMFGRWLALTILALLAVWITAFIALHALLFTFGTDAAKVGLVVTVLLAMAIPVISAAIVRHRGHPAGGGDQHLAHQG
jgi:hypothetical protein